ncbi:MAG: hypothetical protein CVV05_00025 [Gammaproteobacteria bacterium HGW-Gammaproteobacteria-1]|jgi:hypothetical protein|nr:MAG: hypothetical protein CVV05_00025 [Gammaproteobacteria bacterium HGW-Gammaproteobacteria-1]
MQVHIKSVVGAVWSTGAVGASALVVFWAYQLLMGVFADSTVVAGGLTTGFLLFVFTALPVAFIRTLVVLRSPEARRDLLPRAAVHRYWLLLALGIVFLIGLVYAVVLTVDQVHIPWPAVTTQAMPGPFGL